MIDDLIAAVGRGNVLTGEDIGPRYYSDAVGRVGQLPRAVVRPRTTAEVSRVLAICHAHGAPVTTQGGMTGLVQGAMPQAGEIALSLERMNDIEEVDTGNGTVTVQAGCVLQRLQERVEAEGFSFPLDLGARGSCTIGGNIATNAGGNRVIRYGMMRDLVLGLEAVTADGTVVDGLRKYIKNNTGLDLKQLFIGSEGVLGVVTRAVLRIYPQPGDRIVAACAMPGFAEVTGLLQHMRRELAGDLTAFEVMWNRYYRQVIEKIPGVQAPFPADRPFYAIVEASGADRDKVSAGLQAALEGALEQGLIEDAVLSKSQAEALAIWKIRDASVEVSGTMRPCVGFDVSLPIDRMAEFADRADADARGFDPEGYASVFGHLGDGNLHVVVHHSGRQADAAHRIERMIYDLTGSYGGSISAEHGIGLLKRPYLDRSRTAAEIALMRTLKQAMDPKGILNPGRIVEA
jgi:FAD/FMN-containing dehydrogenase